MSWPKMAADKLKSHNNQPKALGHNKGGEEVDLRPAGRAQGERKLNVCEQLSWA